MSILRKSSFNCLCRRPSSLLLHSRTFSSSSESKNQQIEEDEDIFKSVSLSKDSSKDIGFERWYEQIKERLANTKGPYFLGGNRQPFPHNPEYIAPPPPLSDVFKQHLYEAYCQDPQKNTPRALSRIYRISIERIDGIIRLKMHQDRLVREQGYKINQEYLKGMEEILAARTPSTINFNDQPEESSNPKASKKSTGRPLFVAVPEGSPFTFDDAARLLRKTRRRPIKLARFPAEANDEAFTIPADLTIRMDPYEQGKRRFIFVDMSASSESNPIRPSERSILVRDPSGVLRRASKPERIALGRRVWGASSKDFVA